jgi:hypothetical protein
MISAKEWLSVTTETQPSFSTSTTAHPETFGLLFSALSATSELENQRISDFPQRKKSMLLT